MGLFLGCSVLTVLEFIDLIVVYLYSLCRGSKKYSVNENKVEHNDADNKTT